MNKIKYLFLAVVAALSVAACNDPWIEINEGSWNHEHSIIAIEFEGQAGLTEITNIDGATGTVDFKLMSANVPDMSKVGIKTLTLSYGATANVEAGETLDFTGAAPTIAVSSPNGDTRVYTLNMSEFSETLIGMYKIQKHMHYGGTGPEYGGGALMDPQDKSWVWDQKGFGPKAEYDNYFEIIFETINASGNSVGKCIHYAGVDGKFWNCIFQAKHNKEGVTDIDLHKYYRLLPMGTSTWERNYSEGTITFTDAAGKKTVATLMEAGSHFVFNSNGTTDKFIDIANFAFNFALQGVDDWTNIYGDYDKFAKKVRNHYILFEAVESIPEESKTEGTEGDITIAPPPVPVELAMPKITLGKISDTSFSFSWSSVENATGYEFSVTSGEEVIKSGAITLEETSKLVDGLTAETVYSLAIKAIGDGGQLYFDSPWSEVSFTTQKEVVEEGPSLAGTYKVSALQVFTGSDAWSTNLWSIKEKEWVWDNYSHNKEFNNTLTFTPSGRDANGCETGEANYDGGENGFWNYKLIANHNLASDKTTDQDCSDVYNKIPHGKSTYVFDAKAGTVTFTSGDYSVVASYYVNGLTVDYKIGDGKLCSKSVTSTMVLDFAIPAREKNDNYTYQNFDWMYWGVHNYIMSFDLQQ